MDLMAFAQNQRNEVRDLGDAAGTLSAEPGMKQQTYIVQSAGSLVGNSEKARSIGLEEEIAPTIKSMDGGNKPCIVYDARGNGNGETVPTITGDHENRVTDYTAVLCVSVGNGQMHNISMEEQANTLDTMHDQQAVLIAGAGRSSGAEAYPDAGGGTLKSVVRRLTPMECERLQGFPDGWTDIGEWDKPGKNGKTVKVSTSDSARYKACGNSIALPFWRWLLRRICGQYAETPTLGSLFDGIGGFPLCMTQCTGTAKSVRWSSEIEPFCVAVLKRHFGDEDEGTDGDWREWL